MTRIVVFGNSIIVGTVGLVLQRSSQYELIYMASAEDNELEDASPEVVIFDLEAGSSNSLFSLMENRPETKLIGISPDTNLVKVWSGKQLRELSTKELIEVIDEQ